MKTNESSIVQKWLIAAFVLVLISFSSCWRTPPDEMWPTDRIERITKVRVPEYKVTKFVYGPAGIDYTDTIYIEFDSRPSDEVFEKIDELMATNDNSGWYTDDSIHYSFQIYWGNGNPTPEGEKEEDDGIFKLDMTKGEKAGVIVFGCW